MHGTDITHCQSENAIVITKLSSRHGADTGTTQHLKAMLLTKTDTPDALTKSWPTSQTKQNALMSYVHGLTISRAFFQACKWLDFCDRKGIIQSLDKLQFAQDKVEFAGFDVDLDSIKPCKKASASHWEIPNSEVSHQNYSLVRLDQPGQLVEGKQEYGATYTSLKVCVECVTSLVTKVTSDDVTMMIW